MNSLRPPNRKKASLHVLPMALALIAAAFAGEGIGYLIDFGSSKEVSEEAEEEAAAQAE